MIFVYRNQVKVLSINSLIGNFLGQYPVCKSSEDWKGRWVSDDGLYIASSNTYTTEISLVTNYIHRSFLFIY